MSSKPQCPDIAEAIINYFRNECAVSTSNGIDITSYVLANAIGRAQSSTTPHFKKLIDFGIIVLRNGTYGRGQRHNSFALGEGHEEGEEWKKIYYGENTSTTPKVTKKQTPVLASEIIKQKADNDKYAQLLREYLQLTSRFNELQKKHIDVQCERNGALAKAERLATQVEEMKNDLRLEAQTAHQSQEIVTELELQLREARSQIANNDRRIAKHDEKAPQPFAHR